MLVRDAAAPTCRSKSPTSERVNTAMTDAHATRQTSPGSLTLALGTEVARIEPLASALKNGSAKSTLPNDVVFTMLGREAPLDFFRRSGLPCAASGAPRRGSAASAFSLFCVFLYHWKIRPPAEFPVQRGSSKHTLFPYNVPKAIDAARRENRGMVEAPEQSALHREARARESVFYYTLAYCTCVAVLRDSTHPPPAHALREVADDRADCVQCIPLFFLP